MKRTAGEPQQFEFALFLELECRETCSEPEPELHVYSTMTVLA